MAGHIINQDPDNIGPRLVGWLRLAVSVRCGGFLSRRCRVRVRRIHNANKKEQNPGKRLQLMMQAISGHKVLGCWVIEARTNGKYFGHAVSIILNN